MENLQQEENIEENKGEGVEEQNVETNNQENLAQESIPDKKGMGAKAFIFIIVAVVLVLGAVGYFAYSNQSQQYDFYLASFQCDPEVKVSTIDGDAVDIIGFAGEFCNAEINISGKQYECFFGTDEQGNTFDYDTKEDLLQHSCKVGEIKDGEIITENANQETDEVSEESIKASSSSTMSQEIDEWTTYRNERFGYEVSYPPVWYMEENGKTGLIRLSRKIEPEGVDSVYAFSRSFSISVSENSDNKTIADLVNDLPSTYFYNGQYGKIDGQDSFVGDVSGWGMAQYRNMLIVKDNQIFDIGHEYFYEISLDEFDQIMDTFRFIEIKDVEIITENTNQETDEMSCNGIWENNECVVVPFKLLAPVGGENLCLGDDFVIKWEGTGVKSVVVKVYEDAGFGSDVFVVGAYPGTYNEANDPKLGGFVPWSVGEINGEQVISPGSGYKVMISSNGGQSGSPIKRSDVFTITDCRG